MLTKALPAAPHFAAAAVYAAILAAAASGAAQAGTAVFMPTSTGATGSVQTFVVPTTGIYDITAFGAEAALA